MKRMLYRMVLRNDEEGCKVPDSVNIRNYCKQRHHEAIRFAYGESFGHPPWHSDWDKFDEFDANGAFIAEDVETAKVAGFALGFRRRDYGYISVVAVLPAYRRQGVAFVLVRKAINYLRAIGLYTIKVDVFVDEIPAVSFYQKLGFEIESTFEDEEDIPTPE